MRQDKQQKDDNKRIEKSQQVMIPLDMAQQIPADAPVRLLGEILDKMDFGSLERAEKRGAQRRIPGRILFGVLVFGEMKGVYTCRKDEAGKKLDKAAMLICSKALGHNRISVVADYYIRGL